MTTLDSRQIDRTKVSPFLVRVFIKQYPGHRTAQFDGPEFPFQDEYQLYTWMDATLQEILLTLRAITSPALAFNSASNAIGHPPTITELHHPLAKYTFRSVYPDPATGGRFQSKELGDVYARDLSDTAIFDKPFPVPSEREEAKMEDAFVTEAAGAAAGEKAAEEAMDTTETLAPNEENGKDGARHSMGREFRTLQDLRFRKGDYLAVSVRFPKTSAASGLPPASTSFGSGTPGGLGIRGAIGGPSAPGKGGFGGRDAGSARQIPWVTSPVTPTAGTNARDVRRGANWRGGPPTGPGRSGFGGRGDGPTNRRPALPPREDRDEDRRSGPRIGGRGGPSRGGRRSRSGSRSPRRRNRSRGLSMTSSHSKRSKSHSRSRSRSPPRRETK